MQYKQYQFTLSIDKNHDENEIFEIASMIESFLFIFSEPVSINEIVNTVKQQKNKITKSHIEDAINILKQKYSQPYSGLELLELEKKYQLVTKKENYSYLEKFISPTKKKNLTQSALETLTIIAYNQPVTKSFIEDIKGVKCNTTIAKLLEAGLIEESGRLDKIGRPILYKTTDLFLKHLNLSSLDELPNLDEIKNRKYNNDETDED